jgi:hypothetical protein
MELYSIQRIIDLNLSTRNLSKLLDYIQAWIFSLKDLLNTLRNERDHRGSKDIQKKPVRMNEIDDTTPEFKYYEFLTGYANKFVTDQLAKIRFNPQFL